MTFSQSFAIQPLFTPFKPSESVFHNMLSKIQSQSKVKSHDAWQFPVKLILERVILVFLAFLTDFLRSNREHGYEAEILHGNARYIYVWPF